LRRSSHSFDTIDDLRRAALPGNAQTSEDDMKSQMSTQAPSRILPTGFAFEIPDLVMALAWAQFHGLRMVVELDHRAGGEEYEEVLALYSVDSMSLRWIIWCTRQEVVVQPMIGRSTQFGSMAEALEHTISVADKIDGPAANCGRA
jgi:hypothetical protein